jgi:heme exporter protein D
MNWDSLAAFWAMGGYGPFVWGSFGVTAVCIVLEIIVLKLRHRSALKALATAAPNR